MSTDKERMEILLAHLKMNANELAVSLGHKRPDRVYHVLRERNGISTALAREIVNTYPEVRFEWLKDGDGEMMDKESKTKARDAMAKEVAPYEPLHLSKKLEPVKSEEYIMLLEKYNALMTNFKELKKEAEPLNPNAIIYVPLVNQYAYAGYLNGYQNETYMDTLPTIPFIADHEARGNYIAFEVKGDSMNDGTEDSYLEGDRLLCREIPFHLWKDSRLHIKKWDFVIVHEDGIIVKRITDHDVENHTITVHSLNELYPDRVIDLSEVKQIFNVVEMQRPRRR